MDNGIEADGTVRIAALVCLSGLYFPPWFEAEIGAKRLQAQTLTAVYLIPLNVSFGRPS